LLTLCLELTVLTISLNVPGIRQINAVQYSFD